MAYTYQTFASLGVNLNRQKYGALDISSVFTSEADLKYYLSKGAEKTGVSQYWLDVVPYPYAGQVLATVIDDVVNVYVLKEKADGTFETAEVGGKVTADEVSITVSEDGVLGLVGFAAAKSGSRLVKTESGMAWEEPSAITVEGLSDLITALRSDMTTAQADIDALEEKVGAADDAADASGSLFARVAQNAADIVTINGKLTGVFHFKGAAPEGQLVNVESPEVGDVYTVGDKEWAWSGSEWVELGFTTDLSSYSTTEQMNSAIDTAKNEANTYADGVGTSTLTSAKEYADGLKTSLDGDIDAVEAKLGEIPAEKTVKEYVDDGDAAALAAAKADAQSKIDALGALAVKDEVAEADLAAALKSKLDAKADSATTLAGYGIEDGVTKSEMTDALAGLGTMSKENAGDYTKTADLETALTGKYDAAGAAEAVRGVTTETVASVDAKVALNTDALETLNSEGVGSVSKSIDDKIAALDLANTYAAKKHEHAIAEVTDLEDTLSDLDSRIGTLKIGETSYDNVTAYVDAKTTGIATDAQLENLTSEVNTLKVKVDTEGKVSEAIAAAKTELSSDISALEDKVDTLIGDDSGMSARTIASEEVAKIVAGADTAYDTLKEISDWISSHAEDASAMNSAIIALQTTVDTGDKTVSAYVTDAITALKIGDYAKAADLTALATRVTAAEEKLTVLTGADTVDGSVAKALKDAKEYTDTEVAKKATVYYSATEPAALAEGDLWFQLID